MSALELGSRLPDLATEFLTYVLELAQLTDPGDGEVLRGRLNRMLDELKTKAASAKVPGDVIEDARYALIGLVDEVVLTSSWPIKSAWLGKPLQMEHFNSFSAGEAFFTRLDKIKNGGSEWRIELLELYLLCLSLGFKGKHGGVAGLEVLRRLKQELNQLVETHAGSGGPVQSVAVSARDQALGSTRRKTDPNDISPSWRPPHTAIVLTKDLPVRAVVVACLALAVVLFIVFATLLSDQASTVLEGIESAS